MATLTPSYSADTQITITLADLAASSTFVAGREATAIDNSTNKYVDALLSGRLKVGNSGVTAGQILIYVFGKNGSGDWPDVMDGTDSAETLTSLSLGRAFLKLAAVIDVGTTDVDRTYPFGPVALAPLFGGVLPKDWSVFITHNTTDGLSTTEADHEIYYVGIKYDIA